MFWDIDVLDTQIRAVFESMSKPFTAMKCTLIKSTKENRGAAAMAVPRMVALW